MKNCKTAKQTQHNGTIPRKKRRKVILKKESKPSIKEAKGEQFFRIGFIIWGHLSGYPWWPCKIYRVSGDNLLVYFFGSEEKNKWAWIHKRQAKLLSEIDAKELLSKYSSSKSRVVISLRSAIEEAFNEFERKQSAEDKDSDNEDICFVCLKGGSLILCDGCPNACHLSCAGLKEVPEDAWYCKECTEVSKSSKKYYPFEKEYYKNTSREADITSNGIGNGVTNRHPTRVVDPLPRILRRGYWHLLTEFKDSFDKYYKNYTNDLSVNIEDNVTHKKKKKKKRKLDSIESDFSKIMGNGSKNGFKVIRKKRKKEEDTNIRKLYLRYKYQFESDSNYKLIILSFSENDFPKSVCGKMLKKYLQREVSDDYEVRYFDKEDGGWLLLKDSDTFPWQQTNHKLVVQLMCCNKN